MNKNYGEFTFPMPNPDGIWQDETDQSTLDKDFSVVFVFGDRYIKPLFVIVEMWDHKRYGKGKRLYLETFTEKERRIIGRYHTFLYQWYLRTGIPRLGVKMLPSTMNLLHRAANFFGGLP